ncbi:hypothetical protein ACH5RR_013050 [Cinchona calisaya]|uniref:Uncharacterized protein n=1 Tax=Cinchona calisaya TaxID=153742 RepID=A0ABD3A0A9_9GENT
MYEAFGRVLESGVEEHLGNSHVKFLLTRFKNVAYQAEHVANSFVAGEDSAQGAESYAHNDNGNDLCDTVIPTLSSSASSHANYCVTRGSEGEIHNRVEGADNKLVGFKDAEAEIIELLTTMGCSFGES